MRQSNQNKRMRGRSRKASNPLSRTFESNGPDVKIRGTALHVAEKYVQLARDAQASGDRITGENYLQHAEHYFRIIAAAQGPSAIPVRDEDRQDEGQYGNASHNGSGDRNQNQNAVMAADAPQPFVDAMPGIDAKDGGGSSRPARSASRNGKANGADTAPDAAPEQATMDAVLSEAEPQQAAEQASGEGDEQSAAKPKRRARGSRGRGSRTKPAGDAGAEAEGAETESAGAEAVAAPDGADEAEPAPAEAKKPARRTRKAPAKKDAADGGKPSEEAVASEA